MTSKEFLDTYLFKGLTDLNDGFDVESIKYFSREDFEVVLNRAEEYRLEIYGIELWKDREYYDTEIFEFHYTKVTDAADSEWYKHAFEELANEVGNLLFSASYGVRDALLHNVSC